MNVRKIFLTVANELRMTVRRPQRLRFVFSISRLRAKTRYWRQSYLVGDTFENDRQAFTKRVYSSYTDYIRHQQSKFNVLPENAYVLYAMAEVLPDRIRDLELPLSASVLCLGARTGAEVQAFISAGYFAVGIDLNPGISNRFVLTGDFHDLQFADSSVDLVFTNSLDHAFDLDKVIEEACRVLKPRGFLWVEANLGIDDNNGISPGDYEAMGWYSVSNLIDYVSRAGFEIVSETDFELPWHGRSTLMRLV